MKVVIAKEKLPAVCYNQYDRTLAYDFPENGTFVNANLVKNGRRIKI